MTDHTNKSSKEIANEAEATRMSLAGTLDELRDRMTPGVVMDEVLSFARAGGSTLGISFLRAARANPIPALLIGAGCYLFVRGTGSSEASHGGRRGRRFEGTLRPGAEGYIAARGSFAPDRSGAGRGWEQEDEGLLSRAKRAGSRAYGRIAGGADDLVDDGRDLASDARHRAADVADEARRAAGSAYAGATAAAMSARDRAAGTAAAVADSASSAADAVTHAAGDAADAARGAAFAARDAAARAAGTAGDAVSSAAGSVRDTAASAAGSVRGAAASAASAMGERVAGLGSAASHAVDSVKDGVSSAYATTSDAFEAGYREASRRAGYVSRSAVRGAYHAQSDARDYAARTAQEQPLVAAAIGVAIGAALGALLPSTRAEARAMGEASDAVKRQAADLAGEGVDRAKVVVERTVEQVRDEANRQGLTPDLVTGLAQEVAERVKTVASAAVSAAKSEAAQAAGVSDQGRPDPARGSRSANG